MSSSSNRNSPAGPRSWKRSPVSSGPTAASRAAGRWAMTLLTVTLCGVFVLLLMQGCGEVRCHLVAVAVPETDKLTAPLVAFSVEDVDALRELPNVKIALPQEKVLVTTASVADLGKGIQGFSRTGNFRSKRDALLIYFNAQGVSDRGQAYLLCSDFMRPGNNGRFPVEQLLGDLDQQHVPAALKLLILDSGRIDEDPRLAMVVNELPRLVEQMAKELREQPLWILLSNSVFQTSHVDYRRHQSLLGASVIEALQGKADGVFEDDPPDHYVTLPELYCYVSRRCFQWSGAIGAPAQTPLLMKAGKGLVPWRDLEKPSYRGKKYRLVYLKHGAPAPLPGDASSAQAAEQRGSDKSAPAAAAASHGDTPAAAPAKPDIAARPAADGDPSSATQASKKAAGRKQVPATDRSPPAGGGQPPREAHSQTAAAAAARPGDLAGAGPASAEDLLGAAWKLRDQIQDRSGSDGRWSPVDFAPHLWRRLNAQLLYVEQQCLSAAAPIATTSDSDPGAAGPVASKSSAAALGKLRQLVSDLTMLKACLGGAPPAVIGQPLTGEAIGRRLLRAWKRFDSSDGKRSFRETPLSEVAQAIQDFRDAEYAVPYYLRFDAYLQQTPPSAETGQPLILALVEDLIQFRELLTRLQGRELAPDDPALRRLGSLRAAFSGRQQRLRQYMDRRRIEATRRSAAAPARPDIVAAHQHQIEALLSTPLLEAGARMELVGLLSATAETEIPPLSSLVRPDVSLRLAGTPEQWKLLLIRTKAEVGRVRLVDPDNMAEIEPVLEQITTLTERVSEPASEAERWQAYRDLGAILSRFYERLPERVADLTDRQSPGSTTGHRLAVGHLVRATDPRDALRVETTWPFAMFPVRVRVRDDVWLTDIATPVQLSQAASTMQLAIWATRSQLLDNPISVKFDSNLIAVKKLDGDVQPGHDPDRGNEVWRRTVTLRVQAKQDRQQARRSTTPIQLRLAWLRGGQPAIVERRIDCVLPLPNRVDVLVRPKGLARVRDSGDSVSLKLPPNRPTQFEVLLNNRSGRERVATVKLLKVPPSPNVAPGRIGPSVRKLFQSADAGLDSRFQVLTESDVSLPRDGQVTVRFGVSREKTDKEATASESTADQQPPGPNEKKEPASDAAAVDVSHGLVCVVVDPQNQQPIGQKWIELDCLAPAEYVTTSVHYQQDTIHVQLAAIDTVREAALDIPDGSPIRVRWSDPVSPWLDPSYIPEGAARIVSGDLTRQMPRVSLSAQVPSGRKGLDVDHVYLQVDGYPRAFHYAIRCREGERGVDRMRTDSHIGITSVTVPGLDRVYYWPSDPAHWAPPEAEGDKPDPIRRIALQPRQPAVFPARKGDLVVTIQADVPADAWTGLDPRRGIEVGIANRSAFRVRSQRQRTTRLLSAEPSLRLEMRVTDHQFQLPTASASNVKWELSGQIILPGILPNPNDQRRDTRSVWLDGDRPRVTSIRSKSQSNGSLRIEVRVQDFSGVEQVAYGFDLNDLQQAEDTELRSLLLDPASVRQVGADQHVFDLQLDAKPLLKDVPPGQVIEKRLLVRVWDKAGHESQLHQQRLRLQKAGKIRVDAKTNLVGVIRMRQARVNGVLFRATITGASIGSRPIRVQSDGTFRVDGLRPGKYTLGAAGSFSGRGVEGDLQVDVPPTPPPTMSVTIPVEYKQK